MTLSKAVYGATGNWAGAGKVKAQMELYRDHAEPKDGETDQSKHLATA